MVSSNGFGTQPGLNSMSKMLPGMEQKGLWITVLSLPCRAYSELSLLLSLYLKFRCPVESVLASQEILIPKKVFLCMTCRNSQFSVKLTQVQF